MCRRLALPIMLGIIGSGVLAAGWASARADPVVRRATIAMEDWPRGSPPMTVALVSDIHIGSSTMDARRLARIVGQINALRPTLIVLAGDFISGHDPASASRLGAPLASALARLRAPLGTVAVLGNHDHWTDADAVARDLRRAGATVVENAAVRRGPVAIGGLGDMVTRHADLPATLAAMRRVGGARILLTHSPDIAAELTAAPATLVLAGHTHCGQIVLPLVGPLGTVSNHGDRYRCGIVREGRVRVVVSAGLGTSVLPLRYGAPPDLWLLTLGPAAADATRR